MRQPTWLELVLIAVLVGVAAVTLAGPGPVFSSDVLSDGPGAESTPSPEGAAAEQGATGSTPSDGVTASPTNTPSELVDAAAVEYQIHQRINQIRAGRGYDELDLNPKLREAARYHSQDMAQRGYFDHDAPDGETMEDRYERFGLNCRTSAENIAQSWYKTEIDATSGTEYYDTPEGLARGIVQQWMNSPGHRSNILRSEWKAEGLGVYAVQQDGRIKIFATQNFCEP